MSASHHLAGRCLARRRQQAPAAWGNRAGAYHSDEANEAYHREPAGMQTSVYSHVFSILAIRWMTLS